MAYIPLPKEFHEDFSQLQEKPFGEIELDSSHYLADGVRHLYVPQKVGVTRNLGYDKESVDLINVESGDYYNEGFAVTSTELINHDPYADLSYPFTVYTRFVCKQAIPSGTLPLCQYGDLSQSDYVAATVSPFLVRGQLNLNFVSYTADVSTSAHKVVGAITDVIFECISSTEKTAYVWVDGEFIGSTTNSTDSSAQDAALNQFDETRPAIGGTGSDYFDVLVTGLFDGTIADKDAFVSDPYQLVKPVEMPFFIATAAGPTIVDVSLTLGLSTGQTNSGQATAGASITLSQEVGVSDSGQATAGASITLSQEVGVSDSGQGNTNASTDLAAQLGITTDGVVAFNADISLSNEFGYSSTGQATAQVLLTEGLTLEQSVSAIAQAVAAVTFSHSNSYAVSTAGLTVDVNAAMGLSMDMSPLVTVTLVGAVTLGNTLSDQINAQANSLGSCDLSLQIGLQVAARALAEASITISAVTSIVNTGSSIIIGVITPDSRSYTIEVDNRDFLILAENRDYEVK